MEYSNHHLSVTQDGERGEDNKISKKRDGEGRGRGRGEQKGELDRRRDRLGRWRGIYIASVGMENVNQVKRGERPLPEDIFRFTV